MPKLKINAVKSDKLPTEIRRRRAALIDMLADELDTLGYEVTHEPNEKMRKKRAPDDALTERIIVDSIPIGIEVTGMTDEDLLRNKLKLRFSFIRSGEDRMRYPSTAKEPNGGWDITKLAQRIANEADSGKEVYARDAAEKIGEAMAKVITDQFSHLDHRFYIEASSYIGDDDFGPLVLRVRGLCPHLVVEILQRMTRADHDGMCGDAPERHPPTPSSELN